LQARKLSEIQLIEALFKLLECKYFSALPSALPLFFALTQNPMLRQANTNFEFYGMRGAGAFEA
jgi:hypothetical protein